MAERCNDRFTQIRGLKTPYSRMAGAKSGGNRGLMSREVQVSKKLSWLLRHGAEKEGLQLGEGGYVSMTDVVSL